MAVSGGNVKEHKTVTWLAHYLLSVPVRAIVMAVTTLPIPCAYGHAAFDPAHAIHAAMPGGAVSSRGGWLLAEWLPRMAPVRTASQGLAGHLILTGKGHTGPAVAMSGGSR